ncbi:Uncharacterised protein [Acinetobacter baumannii]|nr:Uncharacterised protein [Acinetobacter baumannii]
MELKLPANNKPILTMVMTTDQKMRNQIGESLSLVPPFEDKLAIISVPDPTGVKNKTKQITTTIPAIYGLNGRYSSNLNNDNAGSLKTISPKTFCF